MCTMVHLSSCLSLDLNFILRLLLSCWMPVQCVLFPNMLDRYCSQVTTTISQSQAISKRTSQVIPEGILVILPLCHGMWTSLEIKEYFQYSAVYSFGHTIWIQFYSHGFFFEQWTDACNMCDNFGCGFHCVSKEVCQDRDLWNWTGRYINHHSFLLFSILDKIPVRSCEGIAVPSTWCQTQTQQLGCGFSSFVLNV
jgi:hypothetical protein